jgi:putative Ca2+/H+ antiporter (TMEM165/GDT1 family)
MLLSLGKTNHFQKHKRVAQFNLNWSLGDLYNMSWELFLGELLAEIGDRDQITCISMTLAVNPEYDDFL